MPFYSSLETQTKRSDKTTHYFVMGGRSEECSAFYCTLKLLFAPLLISIYHQSSQQLQKFVWTHTQDRYQGLTLSFSLLQDSLTFDLLSAGGFDFLPLVQYPRGIYEGRAARHIPPLVQTHEDTCHRRAHTRHLPRHTRRV